MFDVMNYLRFSLSSVSLAALALVAVTSQYQCSLAFPDLSLKEFFLSHSRCIRNTALWLRTVFRPLGGIDALSVLVHDLSR